MSRLLHLLLLIVPAISAAVLAAPATSAAPPGHFPLCQGPGRVTCVVDGDTFWLRGAKIRIADINTPETATPSCPREAELGRRATRRLQALLAAGPFELALPADGRAQDRYGRLLRVVTRNGRSLGDTLVNEGLAESWRGRRSDWCGSISATGGRL